MGQGTLSTWPWRRSLLWTYALTTHSNCPLSQDRGSRESAGATSRETPVCAVTCVEPGVCVAVPVCVPDCTYEVLHQPLTQGCRDTLVSVHTLSLGLTGGCDELRAAEWVSPEMGHWKLPP